MKIISWNVKGLGIPKNRSSIKEVFKKYKADLVMIQETKKFQSTCLSNRVEEVGTRIGFILLQKVQPGECLLPGKLIYTLSSLLKMGPFQLD